MGKIRTIGVKGSSLAVTIPPSFLREYGLSKGDRVDMVETDNGLLIRPVDIRPRTRAESES